MSADTPAPAFDLAARLRAYTERRQARKLAALRAPEPEPEPKDDFSARLRRHVRELNDEQEG